MNDTVIINNSDTNIAAAQKLIYAKVEQEVVGQKLHYNFFTPDDLEEIAEHLLAFVKAQRARERRNDK